MVMCEYISLHVCIAERDVSVGSGNRILPQARSDTQVSLLLCFELSEILKYIFVTCPVSCISTWVCRDMKPHNLLLNLDEGLLKVANMGLG